MPNWVEPLISFLSFVLALVMAAISWWNAKKARNSAREAAEARSRTATALEEANRLFAAANPADVPPWGQAKWLEGSLFRVINESKRAVEVRAVWAHSARMAGSLRVDAKVPALFQPGDAIEYQAPSTYQTGPLTTVIEWRWPGTAEWQQTSRNNIKH